jgi:nickel transport protein
VRRGALLLLFVLSGGVAQAHEVLHTVERGKAIAVKAYFADGETLAYAEYQIFSPVDPKIPYQKGRTDRSGYLAFVPDVPGKWRIKVNDSTGHGVDLEVDTAAATPPVHGGVASWTFVARPLLGAVLVAGIFVGLIAFYRRGGKGR